MQRRADFMADVGEETAFGFRGGVGCLHGLLELGVEALEILGLGAFFQFGGQPLEQFHLLAVPGDEQPEVGAGLVSLGKAPEKGGDVLNRI